VVEQVVEMITEAEVLLVVIDFQMEHHQDVMLQVQHL